MITALLNVTVVVGLGIVVYHHIIYPVLLSRIARWMRSAPLPASGARDGGTVIDNSLAYITIVVPAHNEEAFIGAKIRNIADLDYPRDRFKTVLALDGCRDRTKEVALAAARELAPDIDLEIVEYQKNIGKIAVLNDRIAHAKGEVVALSDTSALLPAGALRSASQQFRDPEIGFVAARYRLQQPGSEGERAYMEQLSKVRNDEATLHSPLGVHGALYFFRRSLFEPLPADTINDDFVLPMRILERGYRGRYDNTIEAIELETTGATQEFQRRTRIGAGNMQQSIRLAGLGSPKRPWLSFMFLSGKGLRPFIPFIAIAAVLASLILAALGSSLHGALLAIEVVAITSGLAAIALRGRPLPRLMAWLGYLLEGHAASMIGAIRYLSGGRISSWQGYDPLPSGMQSRVAWASRAGGMSTPPSPSMPWIQPGDGSSGVGSIIAPVGSGQVSAAGGWDG